ncbi:MAG: pantetheine-phosphate adenylyltransferase [Christensenellales bacterium]|jgi:pantetheine-phosphate adenylyltransferase
MRVCVYPGSFDPVTVGHIDIIQRASCMFDKVVVAVLKNSVKHPRFTTEKRMEYLRRSTRQFDNVEVGSFDGLTVDYAKEIGAGFIVRGLRAVSDFENEFQMASMNAHLATTIETLFLMTSTKYSFLSSSIIREVGALGGCIKGLVPDEIHDDVAKMLKERD